MAVIGWLDTGLTEADTFFSTRVGAVDLWSELTDDQKTAALTTAYNEIRHSPQVSIPSSPTAAQKLVLAYAQEEFSLFFIVTDVGGIRREAGQWQNITSAGLVKETYKDDQGLPPRILRILDDYKTQEPAFEIDIYRDETDNPAWDTAFS